MVQHFVILGLFLCFWGDHKDCDIVVVAGGGNNFSKLWDCDDKFRGFELWLW